jgi:hypothetical protein
MDISLSEIKGIGSARLKAFEAAGIRTVRELVMFLPKEYRDLSATVPLAGLQPGDTAAVRVRVAGEAGMRRARKLTIVKVYVTDGTEVGGVKNLFHDDILRFFLWKIRIELSNKPRSVNDILFLPQEGRLVYGSLRCRFADANCGSWLHVAETEGVGGVDAFVRALVPRTPSVICFANATSLKEGGINISQTR